MKQTRAKKTALPCLLQEAQNERMRNLISTVDKDRTVVRPPLCVVALEPKRHHIELPARYSFSAIGPTGSVDLLTVRAEHIAALCVEGSERFVQRRLTPEQSDLSGVCLHVSNPSAQPVSRLRFFVHDLETLAWVLLHGLSMVRARGEIRPAQMHSSGIEQADELYPTPPLGDRGRSLWGAFVHAPTALAFLDISFAEVTATDLEVFVVCRSPLEAKRLEAAKFQLGCVPLVNQRILSVSVTVDPRRTFEPIPVPAGQTVTGVGRVQAFQQEGTWADCRPWLGTRYPWKHRRDADAQYVLAARDGNPCFAIGLAERQRGLDATATHLHVELMLADAAAGQLPPGTAVVGDHGEPGIVAASAAPLLVPFEIEPIELEAETRANGWLARSCRGDVTEGLCAFLERAAGGVCADGRRTPRPSRDPAAMIRYATTHIAPAPGPYPLLILEADLNWPAVEAHRGHLFALVLERSLPLFAPALTGTQLILHTPEGKRQWEPRWPTA